MFVQSSEGRIQRAAKHNQPTPCSGTSTCQSLEIRRGIHRKSLSGHIVILPHVDRPFVDRSNDRPKTASLSLYESLAVKHHCLSGVKRIENRRKVTIAEGQGPACISSIGMPVQVLAASFPGAVCVKILRVAAGYCTSS